MDLQLKKAAEKLEKVNLKETAHREMQAANNSPGWWGWWGSGGGWREYWAVHSGIQCTFSWKGAWTGLGDLFPHSPWWGFHLMTARIWEAKHIWIQQYLLWIMLSYTPSSLNWSISFHHFAGGKSQQRHYKACSCNCCVDTFKSHTIYLNISKVIRVRSMLK